MALSTLLSLTALGVSVSTPVLVLLSLPLLFVLSTLFAHLGGNRRGNPLVWSWVPHMRSALAFGQDPNSFLRWCQRKYGSVFTVNLGGRKMTFVTDPRSYPMITKARDGLSFSVVAAAVGQDVLAQSKSFSTDALVDDAVHGLYAKYLTGANLDEITEKYAEALHRWFDTHMAEVGAAGADAGTKGKTAKSGLLKLVTSAIFSASTQALFGDLLVTPGSVSLTEHPLPPLQTETFDGTFTDDFQRPAKLLETFQKFDEVFPMLYGGLPHFIIKAGVQARDSMICAFQTLRSDSCAFFRAREEAMVLSPPEGSAVTSHPAAQQRKDFGSSQLGMLWALQGNTIPACFWTLFYLMDDARKGGDALDRVLKEIREVSQANKDPSAPAGARVHLSRDALKQLVLLDAAMSEALRLATGSMMLRRATTDLVLDLPSGSLDLKAGDSVAIYPWLTHHDAALFPDPERFVLDRFVGMPVESGMVTAVDGSKVPGGYMPFGAGISMCPGRYFARAEIKIFLLEFLTRFDVTAASADDAQHPGFLLSRAGLGIFPPAKDVSVAYAQKQ